MSRLMSIRERKRAASSACDGKEKSRVHEGFISEAREACGACRAFAPGPGAAADHRPWQWRAPAE